MGTVSYDARAVRIDGKREFLLSGAVHYPRCTAEMWPAIFRTSKKAGLNCIETYVFWEGHEPREGEYDFTGRFDLRAFLQRIHAAGLYCILRIGPYVCAEWNFGGLPWWLLGKKGFSARTWNQPFMEAMERWVRVLMVQIGDLQYTRGGPIVLAQMENEYDGIAADRGVAGQKYLAWAADLGRRAGLEVPLIMCTGAQGEDIETWNGFSVWKQVLELRQRKPEQPLLWTEMWPSWYSCWCHAARERMAEDCAFEIMRFLAVGGTGLNYYMWYGGTNFARDSMYLQTTSYDFGVLDEFGRETRKSRSLARLHRFVERHRAFFLRGRMLAPRCLVADEGGGHDAAVVLYTFTRGRDRLVLAINGTRERQRVPVLGQPVTLQPRAAAALCGTAGGGEIVYRTTDKVRGPRRRPPKPAGVDVAWSVLPEPLPQAGAPAGRGFGPVTFPHNMILASGDRSDYGWYRCVVQRRSAGPAVLQLEVADRVSVWVNGEYVDTQPKKLRENRPRAEDFRVTLDVPLRAGQNEILLLVNAMGLIKHDCMLGCDMAHEGKGLRERPRLAGRTIAVEWSFAPGLWGEESRITDPAVARLLPWRRRVPRRVRLRWVQGVFHLEPASRLFGAALALDVGHLHKGRIWLNGFDLGRYWQEPPWPDYRLPNWQSGYVQEHNLDRPPQQRYHIPASLLQAGENRLVIFSERPDSPAQTALLQM